LYIIQPETNIFPVLPKSMLSSLFDSIYASTNKLFFIKYTPENMLRARRYLITIDLDITAHLDFKLEQTSMYHVNFITRQRDDKKNEMTKPGGVQIGMNILWI